MKCKGGQDAKRPRHDGAAFGPRFATARVQCKLQWLPEIQPVGLLQMAQAHLLSLMSTQLTLSSRLIPESLQERERPRRNTAPVLAKHARLPALSLRATSIRKRGVERDERTRVLREPRELRARADAGQRGEQRGAARGRAAHEQPEEEREVPAHERGARVWVRILRRCGGALCVRDVHAREQRERARAPGALARPACAPGARGAGRARRCGGT
jgi:hypothetical protein